ncbi:flagellin N-terminal helical domain-containing protein [Longirhabdus pacifica]|uniref:flagellin N-terminal helical domain-containing protein n=1 Tax=Longirhabdus pacifica TaxID=2305227 RepID=UPI0010093301|nr:flagellin [Longirhabdus pacifica]
MRINHNISALNTQNQLGRNNTAIGKSLEKLSSGYRINRAGDDAAGLAISEKMRAQIKGLDMAEKNSLDGISLIQTAEANMDEVHSMLQRMRELSVQAINDTNTDDDRASLQLEIDELKDEIDRISENAEFNTKKLLNGDLALDITGTIASTNVTLSSDAYGVNLDAGTYAFEVKAGTTTGEFDIEIKDGTTTIGSASIDVNATPEGTVTINGLEFSWDNAANAVTAGTGTITVDDSKALTFQIGANSGQTMKLNINDIDTSALGVDSIDISTAANAEAALEDITNAINNISAERAKLGANQNRLEHTINNLSTASENLTAAESRIRDVDMAAEMMEYTKQSILVQAGQAMLAQANQLPQGVLQLLG